MEKSTSKRRVIESTVGDEKKGILPIPKKFTEDDPHLGFLQSPHTITALLLAGGALLYFAFTRTETDIIKNTKVGLAAGCLTFLLYSMLQMKDGIFYRPHPAFWRVVMGTAVLYLFGVVFLLFQTPAGAREIFSYIDPKLGKALPERSYAEDCRIFTPEDPVSSYRNIYNAVYDEFIVAHLLGWYSKAFLFRNFYISWTWSILFELCELSLAHILPNFKECWWDQVVLDILLCNGVGIWLGHITLAYFEVKTYNWQGMKSVTHSPLSRAFWQFRADWTPFNWEMFSSFRRFTQVLFLIFLAAVAELNCFFLKAVLWHPASHPLVTGRLILIWLFSLPALREYYQYISDPNCNKLGPMAWLAFAILGVETMVWYKFSDEMFANAEPTPPVVVYSWVAAAVIIIGGAAIYFLIVKKPNQKAADVPVQSKKLN